MRNIRSAGRSLVTGRAGERVYGFVLKSSVGFSKLTFNLVIVTSNAFDRGVSQYFEIRSIPVASRGRITDSLASPSMHGLFFLHNSITFIFYSSYVFSETCLVLFTRLIIYNNKKKDSKTISITQNS